MSLFLSSASNPSMTESTTIIAVTPRPMPRMERTVMKLRKREFFFERRYRNPIQLVHGLSQRCLKAPASRTGAELAGEEGLAILSASGDGGRRLKARAEAL